MDLPANPSAHSVHGVKRGLNSDAMKQTILEWLIYSVGKDPSTATERDWFTALALAVRDRLVDQWLATGREASEQDKKRVYYLSLEFLIGRSLTNSMANLGIRDACRDAMSELGVDIDTILSVEPDAALGNGGLGRLAACFLDSMATLGIAGMGYGIRYDFGMFRQRFDNGNQAEEPEDWLRHGNPWEFERAEASYPISFYGNVEEVRDDNGRRRYVWNNAQTVLAVAYDTPVVGWEGKTINTLRLWRAEPTQELNLVEFNKGDYFAAVEDRVMSEKLSAVLYPADSHIEGQELRLRQEYFFTSASLQDILRRFKQDHSRWDLLTEKVAIQLNDTHPAIAVPELMRLLMDEEGLAFDVAWEITRNTINYTNHTLLPEALEAWPVSLIQRVLPRHLQIIYDINARFLRQAMQTPGIDDGQLARLSLIDEQGERRVRMGNLAFVGSRRVNGVSALHTELMKETVFADLHRAFPGRIVNKTNGITPRRWLAQCNRPLSDLITETIGGGWEADLERLDALSDHAGDASFQEQFVAAKRANKQRLAQYLDQVLDLDCDPEALFDIQIKRIHEYKRQHLNILHTIALYNEMRDRPMANWTPRVKVFGGKAAANYFMAKLIIKLGNDVARVINHDPAVRGLLKVAFIPNYNVSSAEILIPAADLSEQISTAGYEASGTGNMKFALNGALTIGTLDGANVEIQDRVGPDNIYIFGKTAAEVQSLKRDGYSGSGFIDHDPRLKRALDMVATGVFSPDDRERYRWFVDTLRGSDPFLVTADFTSYHDLQMQVSEDYLDQSNWMRRAALNTAKVGWFSSDRTIAEYASEIWNAPGTSGGATPQAAE